MQKVLVVLPELTYDHKHNMNSENLKAPLVFDYNLLRVTPSSVFAIICHMATVLWVQTEMCNGSVHSNSTVFHLRSPLAQFHYPQGIQGVMASRARNPAGHFKFFCSELLFRNCVSISVRRENCEHICTSADFL